MKNIRSLRYALAAATVLGFGGNAFALDGNDLVAKINAGLQSAKLTPASVEVSGSTVTLKGVKVQPLEGASEGGAIGEAVAFQESDEGADAGEPARQRPRAGALAPAARHEAADIGHAQLREIGDRRRIADMQRHEGEKLLQVAAIGLERLRREPPLAAQMLLPRIDPRERVGGGEDERRRIGHGG